MQYPPAAVSVPEEIDTDGGEDYQGPTGEGSAQEGPTGQGSTSEGPT